MQGINMEQMPSFVSPSNQPYHVYQTMQDIYANNGINNTMNAQPVQQPMPNAMGSMESQQSVWK